VSRRSFLAGSAAVASGALLAQRGWVDAQAFFGPDGIDVEGLEQNGYRVRHAICHQCGAGCGLTALMRGDGPPTEDNLLILPNQHPDHPQRGFCGRGATAAYTWDSPLRLRTPLKRVGERGEGAFEEISWDQALDEIAAKLREIVERDGARTVALTTHDFAEAAQWLAWPIGTPNVVKQASTCNTAGVVGRKWVMGKKYSKHSTVDPDYEHVRYVLFPGRSLNAPIGAVHRLAEAREHGAKAVFLNPAMPDVAFAAGEWLSCKPGTDAAFLLGVAHVLVREGTYDEAFVRAQTDLPFLIKEDGLPLTEADLNAAGDEARFAVWDETAQAVAYHDQPEVRAALAFEGEIAGTDGTAIPVASAWTRLERHLAAYAPDAAAEMSGVPAADVERVARDIYAMQGVVEDTWYNTRNGNDTDAIMAGLTVNALLGNIEKPGGLCFRPSAKLSGAMSRSGDGMVSTVLGDGFAMDVEPKIDKILYPETNHTFDAVLQGVLDEDPYPVRALVLLGATLFHRDPNTTKVQDALRKLELVVNVDIVHQEVCDWSDYVLPADMFLERDGLGSVGWTQQAAVAMQRKVIDPPEGVQARPNEWIMLEILRRAYPQRAAMMGYDESLSDPETFRRDFLGRILDARIDGLAANWDRDPAELRETLQRDGFVILEEQRFGKVPNEGSFDTSSGRMEVYALAPVQKGYRSHGFAEQFDPPAYAMPTAEDEFYLVNGKSPIGSSGVSSLAFPTQYLVDNALWLHPSDAQRLGLADGEEATVEGLDTGWVATSEVRVTPRVHPGVAYVYSYAGGNRQGAVANDPRFAKMAKGLNPHWFSRSWIDPVTGSNSNNASIRVRKA
jgi:anaerobic selenocysteine-containing dehydrogenase